MDYFPFNELPLELQYYILSENLSIYPTFARICKSFYMLTQDPIIIKRLSELPISYHEIRLIIKSYCDNYEKLYDSRGFRLQFYRLADPVPTKLEDLHVAGATLEKSQFNWVIRAYDIIYSPITASVQALGRYHTPIQYSSMGEAINYLTGNAIIQPFPYLRFEILSRRHTCIKHYPLYSREMTRQTFNRDFRTFFELIYRFPNVDGIQKPLMNYINCSLLDTGLDETPIITILRSEANDDEISQFRLHLSFAGELDKFIYNLLDS